MREAMWQQSLQPPKRKETIGIIINLRLLAIDRIVYCRVINGSKLWITNAGVSDWMFVLAVTDKGAGAGRRMTGFIVESNTPGVSFGDKLVNMGQRCSGLCFENYVASFFCDFYFIDTRPVFFDNVVVPNSNVLGSVGQGFKIAMGAFDNTRPPVAIGAVGVARRAMDEVSSIHVSATL